MIHVCELPQVTPRLDEKRLTPKGKSKRTARGNDFKLKYKTEICRGWEQGECAFGDQCAFAHGPWELRDKHSLEGKKAKPCKAFQTLGYCMMGARCQYVHSLTHTYTQSLHSSPVSADITQSRSRRLRVFIELEVKASL